VRRLKSYGSSPEIGLWVHGMYLVAIAHEIGAQAKISVAPDPPEKAGYYTGPSQPNRLGNCSGLTRSIHNIGRASALLDNNRLVLRLDPHHRLCCPKVNCQFARLRPA